jgi:hypothetical protein
MLEFISAIICFSGYIFCIARLMNYKYIQKIHGLLSHDSLIRERVMQGWLVGFTPTFIHSIFVIVEYIF